MRWVKLSFPPRVRLREPFMTRRLTSSSLAGTSRKLVAVGTSRLASMLATIRAAAPRSGWGSAAPFELIAGAGAAGFVGFDVSGGGGGGVTADAGFDPGSPPPLRPVAGWATF